MATRRLGGIATSSSVPDNGGDHSGGGGSAGGYVDDVFSTYLYEGTGADQDIENGVDLDGEGGMVWIKNRSAARDHSLYDTERGSGYRLRTNGAEPHASYPDTLSSFNAEGFSLGSDSSMFVNVSGEDYASWTFRKQPKFFDLVTYTGTGTQNRSVPHNLGCRPGMVIVKSIDQSRSWSVWHNSFPEWTGNTTDGDVSGGNATGYLLLDKTDEYSNRGYFTHVNDSSFGVNFNRADLNADGETYVAYVFAHDDSDESMIKCGSYTGTGAAGNEIDLGFEPQWVMLKSTTGSHGWIMHDTMRGWTADGKPIARLRADTADEEYNDANYTEIAVTSTGFRMTDTHASTNGSGEEYIYMAIRRPNKPAEEFEPEELFAMFRSNNPGNMGGLPGFRSGFPVDMAFWTTPDGGGTYKYIGDRPNQGSHLYTHGTDAALTSGSIPDNFKFDYNNGYYSDGNAQWFSWMWRRAPGFFDVVTHTCDGNRDSLYPHSLGVVPDMVWRKELNNDANWQVWVRDMPNGNDGADGGVYLNDPGQYYTTNTQWAFKVPPTDTHLSNGVFRTAGREIVSYLFASAPGISKVGIYSGTGAEIDVDCGFTTGARFVLIKRADATGDWYFWDTERGITAGNDPYLLLNDTAAQVTNTDYIDPLSSGFKVTASAPAAINASGGNYIFYAVSS